MCAPAAGWGCGKPHFKPLVEHAEPGETTTRQACEVVDPFARVSRQAPQGGLILVAFDLGYGLTDTLCWREWTSQACATTLLVVASGLVENSYTFSTFQPKCWVQCPHAGVSAINEAGPLSPMGTPGIDSVASRSVRSLGAVVTSQLAERLWGAPELMRARIVACQTAPSLVAADELSSSRHCGEAPSYCSPSQYLRVNNPDTQHCTSAVTWRQRLCVSESLGA